MESTSKWRFLLPLTVLMFVCAFEAFRGIALQRTTWGRGLAIEVYTGPDAVSLGLRWLLAAVLLAACIWGLNLWFDSEDV